MVGSEADKSPGGSRVAPPSRRARGGQANAGRRAGWRPILALAGAGLALGACNARPGEGGDCPVAQRAHTVSGYCVPRYVSLKRGEVYGRRGPGKDYPAVWIYRARGLPVQVVAETSEWRRICDSDGVASWINRAMVDGRRTVISVGAGSVALEKSPQPGAPTVGLLAPRTLANLKDCRGDWCRVSVAGVTGWAPAQRLWGVAPAAQCR